MRKIALFTVISTLLLLATGCIENDSSANNDDYTSNGSIRVTSIQQINDTLENKPVLIEFGAEWCSACDKQRPIIEEIAREYKKDAEVMYVNVDVTPDIARRFNIQSIPDSVVVVGINDNGNYVYMTENGDTTTQREKARFIGLTQKQRLTKTLEFAVENKG
ncbi:MAG: thioredoxin family protein [Methanohalobium sp.]|uniref:thioredoxin family protein n=1 Tax=Methanohalobium sp. TaxID=2837493 RepID=UPI003978113D